MTTYYKHFQEDSIEQQAEKKKWAEEEKLMVKALRDAVEKAQEKRKLTVEQAMKYFQSSRKFEMIYV